ncbi:MAG: tetratricopeptide repeat protein [candidate division NC10 bacterium]|nr:tetratricopeptide repeat protein [candidate division NC10 bacterium]
MGALLWLVVIALVIGISGGYLAYRVIGSGPSATTAAPGAADPTVPWRARLLQNPDDPTAILGLAHAHLDLGQLADAESLYQKVLSRDPKNVEAITHLGGVYLGRGAADAALRQYDEALTLQPDYVHALWDKGHFLQQVKRDYRSAIRTWEAFIRAVGADSQDAKTAQGFIAEARKAMEGAPANAPASSKGKS